MSEGKSKHDGMEHEGQLVAGSGTAEGHSREGSDVDDRLNHTADPTRGAKASSLHPRSGFGGQISGAFLVSTCAQSIRIWHFFFGR